MRGSRQLSSGSSQLSSARALLCVSTLNNCLDIDHSCSHLPAVNPAIFRGVTFNNFGSGLIYGSNKQNAISRPVLCSPMHYVSIM